MSKRRSAEEVKAFYVAAMGEEMGRIYHLLWNQCATIHVKWHAYRTLFGTSPDRIALLNRAAPVTLRIMQDAMLDEIVLHVCRLD